MATNVSTLVIDNVLLSVQKVTAIARSLAETSAAGAEAIPLEVVGCTLSGSGWMPLGVVGTQRGQATVEGNFEHHHWEIGLLAGLAVASQLKPLLSDSGTNGSLVCLRFLRLLLKYDHPLCRADMI